MISVRESIRDTIAEEMRKDTSVFLIGEEVGEYQGAYKVSQGLLDEFGPERIIDTPITEAGFTGLAVGAAMNGLKPIVEFMTWNFAMQAIDHIINSAAKTYYMSGGKINIPIVFRGPNGSASRVAAQHSQDFSAWYSHVPGLKVVAPYDSTDAKLLMKAAVLDPNPVVFLEHELLYNEKFVLDEKEHSVEVGKAKILEEGKDITIVSFSRGLKLALDAHKALKNINISSEVINLRSLKPFDKNSIKNSIKKTGRVIVIEEGWKEYGVGAEIISMVVEEAFDFLDAEPIRVSGKNVPLPYAENLESDALPNLDEILQKAKKVCYYEEKN
jgi:pyruvate dehydrogenase E1 component beta subunit